jgi:glutamate-ammonia-ligase adenylyltransferase
VADDLSALADSGAARHHPLVLEPPEEPAPRRAQFAIIAYGKLGGKELGYGSDLDIVFRVFDDDDERASEVYAAFVRKLINWLTVKTGEGDLYEIDTALRPNGNSGLLVTSFDAYANYQQQRGSNTAWTWEHQAMTRARFVLGDDAMRQRFDAVRRGRHHRAARCRRAAREIVTMRDKVRAAHPVKAGRFDVKHSPGGMVDVEFACSTWCCRSRRSTRNWSATWATSPCCSAPRRRACCPAASATPPPTPTANCGACSTMHDSTKKRPRWHLPVLRPSVLPFWPCGKRYLLPRINPNSIGSA